MLNKIANYHYLLPLYTELLLIQQNQNPSSSVWAYGSSKEWHRKLSHCLPSFASLVLSFTELENISAPLFCSQAACSVSWVSADGLGDLRACWCCWSLVQGRWNSQQWFLKSPQPSAALTWPKRRKPGGYALLDQLGEWKTIWHSARASYTLLSKHFACQCHSSTKGQRETERHRSKKLS